MNKIDPVYLCPHCKNPYKTEEEALSCGKRLLDLVQEGDVVDFKHMRYGEIKSVGDNFVSADATKDYILAKGYTVKQFFEYKSVSWSNRYVCGGHAKHSHFLMSQRDADYLVKNLTKRLKHAKSLQQKVKAMWYRRNQQ